MDTNYSSSNIFDKFVWVIMGLILSTQPVLGIPFSIIAVMYGLTYKDKRKLSYVRLINFIFGLTGIVLSIRTLLNRIHTDIYNIFLF